MKRFLANLAGSALAITLSAFIALFAFGYILGTYTPYCLWSHKLSDTAACVILDHDGRRILIQHADLDTNQYFLEILEGRRSTTFKMPDSITQLAPQGYSAELILGDESAIFLNGERYILEPLVVD
jgi:hypothetical protein